MVDFPTSKNKAPNKVVIDLLQTTWTKYLDSDSGNKEKIESILKWSVINRLPTDFFPSVHCVFDTIDHNQRGMKQQVSYDMHNLEVIYFTKNPNNIWSTHQSIKQILVGNNKVSETNQIKETGAEIINVVKTEFFEIMSDKENVTYYFVIDIVYKLQESYLS